MNLEQKVEYLVDHVLVFASKRGFASLHCPIHGWTK